MEKPGCGKEKRPAGSLTGVFWVEKDRMMHLNEERTGVEVIAAT